MAKVQRPVTNLTALDKEIYRLQLEARKLEDKLDENVAYLREHAAGMTFNSVFRRQRSGSDMLKDKIADSIWSNPRLQDGLCRIIDHLVDKAAEGVEKFAEKMAAAGEKKE
jgi:hypothetical protein